MEKAREFYIEFLGFAVDWEHRFEGVAPVYMQVSRGNLVLHLSEHHGDACPGPGPGDLGAIGGPPAERG